MGDVGPYVFGELSRESRSCKQSERYLWMLDICLISKFRGKIQALNKIWFQQDVATIHIQPMLWWAIWGKCFLWQWHFALTASLWLSFEDIISNEYTNKPLTLQELKETISQLIVFIPNDDISFLSCITESTRLNLNQ